MMIDYRRGKKRFRPNRLGSLYIDQNEVQKGKRPIIYIGGQMEHRCHVLEQTGKTNDPGHNMFSGSWFYDYPIFKNYKKQINAENFTINLLEALEMAGLGDIDLVTESFGGIIGAYASKDPRIHNVYAIHPPITGTPLANPEELKKYRELFTKQEKLIRFLLNRIVNTTFGFEQDNYKGANLSKVDLNKLLVIGSSLDLETEKNGLAKSLYNIIMKSTGHPSDGVVIYDEELFEQLGINYLKETRGLNHFDAGSIENLEEVRRLITTNQKSVSWQYIVLQTALEKWRKAYDKQDLQAKLAATKQILQINIDESDDLVFLKKQLDASLAKSDDISSTHWVQNVLDKINMEMNALEPETIKKYAIKPIK